MPAAPDDSDIKHVSDTALWVAAYRAEETERPDALFRDPLASVLIGDRGKRIAQAMPHARLMRWVLTVRTVAIDRLIEKALAEGADAVVNLGSGMDTRPYRMRLPKELAWIEVDFPDTVAHKNTRLREHSPVCRLERIALDLSDLAKRRELFKRLAGNAKKIVVITEGVIPYLTNDAAASLADDLHAHPEFSLWIQDYFNGDARAPALRWRKRLAAAPIVFQAKGEWLEFFAGHGWRAHETILAIEESQRIGRPLPFIFPWSLLAFLMPPTRRDKLRRMNGYVLLERV